MLSYAGGGSLFGTECNSISGAFPVDDVLLFANTAGSVLTSNEKHGF